VAIDGSATCASSGLRGCAYATRSWRRSRRAGLRRAPKL
jgi:hypothetical protein